MGVGLIVTTDTLTGLVTDWLFEVGMVLSERPQLAAEIKSKRRTTTTYKL